MICYYIISNFKVRLIIISKGENMTPSQRETLRRVNDLPFGEGIISFYQINNKITREDIV